MLLDATPLCIVPLERRELVLSNGVLLSVPSVPGPLPPHHLPPTPATSLHVHISLTDIIAKKKAGIDIAEEDEVIPETMIPENDGPAPGRKMMIRENDDPPG